MVVLSGEEAGEHIQDTPRLRELVGQGCCIPHNPDCTPGQGSGCERCDDGTVDGASRIWDGVEVEGERAKSGSEPGLITRSNPIRAVPDFERLSVG